MCIFRIFQVVLLSLFPSLAAAEGLGELATTKLPIERVVARDMHPNIDLRDFRHLHWAAVRDQPDVVQNLIDQGHEVDERDARGRTPLMVAAAFDSRRAASVLLANGADPLKRDGISGETALHFAAVTGHTEFAKLLLDHGADVGARSAQVDATPLHYAALYGHHETIALLAERGAIIDIADLRGIRPLQYARIRQRTQAIETLLELGARPDDLFDAVNAGDVARVKALITAGADVNQQGLSGTPLHLAVSTGGIGIALMLLDAGADIEAIGDPGGAHPLHLASYVNQPEATKLLLDRGADVDARDALERTALGIAAAYGYVEVVAMLLDHRADPNVAALESCGRPLQYAMKSNSLIIADLLLAHGAAINEASAGGVTALHCAMRRAIHQSSLAMVELLMARGADPSIADWNGDTAIDCAMVHGNPRLISLVLSERASK